MAVKDTDKGYKDLMEKFSHINSTPVSITVGVHGDQSSRNLEVATANEFGEGNNPERSFIRDWFDEQQTENGRLIGKALAVWAENGGKATHQEALKQAAVLMAANIKKRIVGGIAPENAASTIARKGSSTPLIDTSQLINSIFGKVDGEDAG